MKTLEQYPDILNVEDLQEILGIGRRQAYELVSTGQFNIVRVGRRIKIYKAVLIEWLYGEEKLI
ncbi:helix-turn-helix domain-containing protein [Bacillus pinisoli]|uniref:helix-turn-helix domain-containing protein n=1 Tax=Bacillus pinisoli TaxID=2901866 RepID=UPI001FF58BD5|nr:helix-turn-helix domain-containing protein [Bacillus pinisoli]